MPKNKFFPLLVISLIVVGFAIWLTLRPAKGIISIPQNPHPLATISTSPAVYSGPRSTFSYPGTYYLQPNSTASADLVDRVILLGSGTSSKKVALSVQKTTLSSLSDLPAVQMRRLNPQKYTEKPFTLAGVDGTQFIRNTDNFELTGLVINNGLLFTVSLSSVSLGPILEKEYLDDFRFITSSWEWK